MKKILPFSSRNLMTLALIPIYFVAAKIGLSMAFHGTNISPVWPPSGIGLAMVLLFGARIWPGIAVGAFLANYLTGLPLSTSEFISVGNTLEALAAAFFIEYFVRGTNPILPTEETRNPLEKPQSILYFLLGCMLSSVIAATIGTTAVFLTHHGADNSYSYLWSTWWLGDTVGMILVTPFVLAWSVKRQDARHPFLKEPLPVLILFGGILLAGWGIFGGAFSATAPLTYLTLPLLVIIAFRYELRGASAAILLLSAMAVWGTRHGYGPFNRNDLNESLLLLQVFMGVIAATSLFVAGAVTKQEGDEKVIHAQLKEKEVLLQELHHRVKNNLQLISSLLRLQATEADVSTQKFLQESQNRVQSMALIHERLYGREDLREIDMDLYIRDISSFLTSSYGIQPGKIEIDILCEKVFLGVDKAIPCGLIVNEVITNAFKHGFVGREKGRISIHFACKDQSYQLTIEDDGVGIPKDGHVLDSSDSLGLRLIKLLSAQLGGTLSVETQVGTKFLLHFASP